MGGTTRRFLEGDRNIARQLALTTQHHIGIVP